MFWDLDQASVAQWQAVPRLHDKRQKANVQQYDQGRINIFWGPRLIFMGSFIGTLQHNVIYSRSDPELLTVLWHLDYYRALVGYTQ